MFIYASSMECLDHHLSEFKFFILPKKREVKTRTSMLNISVLDYT